jgi:DnaK suppressor protein
MGDVLDSPCSAHLRAIDENGGVDNDRARTLLAAERTRVEGLIAGLRVDRADNRDLEDEQDVDWSDPAQPLTSEGTDDAVAAGLQDRLQAIDRAEARLAAGTYGRSVRSGAPISDERLEADPAAELTVEEASSAPGGL